MLAFNNQATITGNSKQVLSRMGKRVPVQETVNALPPSGSSSDNNNNTSLCPCSLTEQAIYLPMFFIKLETSL